MVEKGKILRLQMDISLTSIEEARDGRNREDTQMDISLTSIEEARDGRNREDTKATD